VQRSFNTKADEHANAALDNRAPRDVFQPALDEAPKPFTTEQLENALFSHRRIRGSGPSAVRLLTTHH
jgi:hypothetical protein